VLEISNLIQSAIHTRLGLYFAKKKKGTCRAAYEFGYALANEAQGWVVPETKLSKDEVFDMPVV
jgi:hypothetical protein